MPIPSSWVDHVFAKLSIRYGAAFARQWPDADPALVKADWAEVLYGTGRDSLAYALRNLPAQPLNAMQFRDLCRRAPLPVRAALPGPASRPDPARVQAMLAQLHAAVAAAECLSQPERCVRNIARSVEQQGFASLAQRHQLRALAQVPGRSG